MVVTRVRTEAEVVKPDVVVVPAPKERKEK